MMQFLWRALTMGSAAVALFFLRFWIVGRERLFLFFALAFAALSVHWFGLGIVNPTAESRHYLYVLRLVAFLLIIAGIVDRNRSARRR
jgi:hypothetical protein